MTSNQIDNRTNEFYQYEVEYRIHASQRMFQRGITPEEIEKILTEGHVIENYSEDVPLPSMLLSGNTTKGVPLHVVVGVNYSEKKLIVITAYLPDANKWADNFSRRK